MASDLDKFVLQYTVELKDSIARLEKLNSKVKDVEKNSYGAGKKVGDFAKSATNEITKLVPGINSVSTAVLGMGRAFGVAGVALLGLTAGVASLMRMRDQYNNQRLVGQSVGVSGMRIEEYQRKLQRHGAGYVTRAQTEDAVRSITNKAAAAYADPTRMGQDAKLFNMLGIDVGARGKGSRAGNAIIADVAAKLSRSTPKEAQAYGQQLGLSPDITAAMRKAGASMGSVTEMTKSEMEGREKAQANLDKFNEATAKLSEQFTVLTNKIAEKLIPVVNALLTSDEHTGVTDFLAKSNVPIVSQLAKLVSVGHKKAVDETAKAKAEQAAAEKSDGAADKMMDLADKEAHDGKVATDEFQLAINMFTGAVTSFANAVDERQAMAAWAGEIGKAAGLAGTGAPSESYNAGLAKNTQFDAMFASAEKKHGLPQGVLKRIAGVESNFNPDARSSAGAQGLMQLMPSNSKAFGIKNPYDPEENIHGGARLLADYLRRSGGDLRQALMMYHGGLDQKGWGPLTTAYPDKVLNMGKVSSGAESKANIRLRQTYDNIAAALGVDPRQLKAGGVNRGDVTWQANQMEAGLQNKIFDLRRQSQSANLPATEYQRIQREINDQTIALNTLRENRGAVEAKAQTGERSITIGAIPITVHFGGAPNVNQTQIEAGVRSGVQQGVAAAINERNSGNKL